VHHVALSDRVKAQQSDEKGQFTVLNTDGTATGTNVIVVVVP
jgi:hypothetical protein